MFNKQKFITRTLSKAKKDWGLGDWDITWVDDREANKIGGAFIEPDRFSEHRAVVHIDLEYPDYNDSFKLRRDIYHELGHAVVFPIWLGSTDWADHLIKSKKMRKIFEEQANTRENQVIDHIVRYMLKITDETQQETN